MKTDTSDIRRALVTYINAKLENHDFHTPHSIAKSLGHKGSTSIRRAIDPHNSGKNASIDNLLRILALVEPNFEIEIKCSGGVFSTKITGGN